MLRDCRWCKQLIRMISLCVIPCFLALYSSFLAAQDQPEQSVQGHETPPMAPPLITASIVSVEAAMQQAAAPQAYPQPANDNHSSSGAHFVLLWIMGVLSFCAVTVYLSSLRRFR
ncbi:hypothetical protein TDB9533_00240 [Thalassocella blandensis]|nr:hypothetical protein TDB9533_00240 [Thalassocella blandensis]